MSRIVQGYTKTGAIITINTQEQQYSWVCKDIGYTPKKLEEFLLGMGCLEFDNNWHEETLRKQITEYIKGE